MLKLNEELKDKIAYGLIGLILLSTIIPLFIPIESMVVFSFHTFFIAALAVFYTVISEKKDFILLTFALFAVQWFCRFFLLSSNELYYSIFLAAPFIAAAIALGILAYKHSVEFKSFEMLECLLVVFLLIYASRFLIATEYDLYYAFCLSFLIATLMYNNNLWLRYEEAEKNLLIFLLVLAFVEVIQVSAKYISF
jgi:hypothetical protein